MGLNPGDGSAGDGSVLFDIAGVAGLDEEPPSYPPKGGRLGVPETFPFLEGVEGRVVWVSGGEDDFKFIARGEDGRGAGTESILRGEGDPVDARGKGARAVGLYGYLKACGMEGGDEELIDKKGGLSAGEDKKPPGTFYFFHNFLCRHQRVGLVVGVAEGAAEIAAAEAYEDGRATGIDAFALQTVEYLVNRIGFHIPA